MKRFAVLVGAAALVVGGMVAMSASVDAQTSASPPAAAQAGQRAQPASPAGARTMSMMNQDPAAQPATGQMMGQGGMMGQGQMMGSNANTRELLDAVKAAKGDAKIDALADLIVGLFSRSRGMMSSSGMGMMGGMMGMGGGMRGGAGMMGGTAGPGGLMRPAPQPQR